MLTPSFELQQSKDFLTIIIKAPFAKVAETEIFIEENDFKFYSKPYFLRLTLPGNIVEDGREQADYDVDKGTFTVVVPKETSGEHFEGLDMITKLLAPKKATKKSTSLIEVVDDVGAEGKDIDDDDENDDDEEDFDWCIEQEPFVEKEGFLDSPKYGFANQKSGVFERLQEDMVYIVDCPEPDKHSVVEKRELRLQAEWEKFDEDHYLADLFEDDIVKQLLQFKPRIYKELQLVQNGMSVEKAVELTDEEKDVLKKLPRKEYILDSVEETGVYLGLVDIVYAYAYNHRTTEGENHCESGWTISKISATLSWLEVFSNLKEVLCSCYRRSLCYPLYRHWGLNETVLQDVIQIFRIGKRCILKVLLEIRSILMDQENRYVLNDLYITDYCVWIQSASSKRLQTLAEALSKICITKDDVGFNLTEIEQLAQAALEGGEDVDVEIGDLEKQLKETNIGTKDDDDDESDTIDSDDDDDTATDSDKIISCDQDCSVEKSLDDNPAENLNPKTGLRNLIQVIDSVDDSSNSNIASVETEDDVKVRQNFEIKGIGASELTNECKVSCETKENDFEKSLDEITAASDQNASEMDKIEKQVENIGLT